MCDAKEWKDYVNDSRTICKFGNKCYQRNTDHHNLYKHPPKRNSRINEGNRAQRRFSPYSRDKNQTNKDKIPEPETSKVAKDIVSDVKQKVDNRKSVNQDDEVNEPEHERSATSNLEQNDKKCCITLPVNLTFYDSTTNPNILKELFLVEMPSDFYKLFDCLNVNNAFEKTLQSVNLEVIGPYDLLLGKLPKLDKKELYLSHWRFFYDPPEFQAVLKKKGKSEYHIGYFRDDPNEKPVFLASNDSSKGCLIAPIAENIFGALYSYLQNEKKASPFTAMVCQKLIDKIKKYAEENNYSLEEYNVKKRLSQVVTKTFHGAGIVVPYNKKTQLGYRHLVETDASIKKLFAKFQSAKTEREKDAVLSEIQPIITYASIAVDECDFGTGIEAGIALFCSGFKELEPAALSSLTAAYSQLNREEFSKIIQAHLKHRRRGPNMSLLSLAEK